MRSLMMFLGFLSFIACDTIESNDKIIDLTGTWVGCDKEGYYRECHFWENTTLTCLEGALELSTPRFYSIIGDSIYYYNPILGKHLPDRLLFNDSELQLFSGNGDIIDLIKISDFPVHPYNSKLILDMPTAARTHYQFMFSKRKTIHKCKVERTPSEQIDTLNDNFEEIFPRQN